MIGIIYTILQGIISFFQIPRELLYWNISKLSESQRFTFLKDFKISRESYFSNILKLSEFLGNRILRSLKITEIPRESLFKHLKIPRESLFRNIQKSALNMSVTGENTKIWKKGDRDVSRQRHLAETHPWEDQSLARVWIINDFQHQVTKIMKFQNWEFIDK